MVQKKIKTIIWSKDASNQYYEIIEYLSLKAPEALSIVGNGLLDVIENLKTEYNFYAPDRFKNNNDGTFRAVTLYSYKISYLVDSNSVNILRIRHTSREPLNY